LPPVYYCLNFTGYKNKIKVFLSVSALAIRGYYYRSGAADGAFVLADTATDTMGRVNIRTLKLNLNLKFCTTIELGDR
jgi:hypothetical protein